MSIVSPETVVISRNDWNVITIIHISRRKHTKPYSRPLITSIPTTISEIYPDLKSFQTKNRRFKKNIRPFCTVSCNFGRKISYL